jgi:S1-C subfamily serine protease
MKTFGAVVLFVASLAFFVWTIIFDLNSKPVAPVVSVQEQSSSTPASQVATTTQKVAVKNSTTKSSATNTTKTATKTTINTTTEVQIPQPVIDLAALNAQTRLALVNILCDTTAGGSLSPISGSGVVVSPDGVILTVAHVAEFFLLKDLYGPNSVQCVIRVGSPAYATYNAELVYISPTWISQNKSVLLEAVPSGTGEHDYAFLRITGKIDRTTLPSTFSFLPVSLSEADQTGQFALLAAYPAGFLGGQSIVQNLFQSSAETTVQKVFTFFKNTTDLLSLPGTIISQGGSSGGAVVNGLGQLEGIISTDTSASQTSNRELNAITTAYINRDLDAESGQTIAEMLASPAAYAQNFNATIAPKLTQILSNAILQK